MIEQLPQGDASHLSSFSALFGWRGARIIRLISTVRKAGGDPVKSAARARS
jgi:hypothetical protein